MEKIQVYDFLLATFECLKKCLKDFQGTTKLFFEALEVMCKSFHSDFLYTEDRLEPGNEWVKLRFSFLSQSKETWFRIEKQET